MTDDLEFLRTRVPGYREYGEEEARHDSDMRIRAFVGERLTDAQVRLGKLDQPTEAALEAVLFRCMFTDQVFIKKFEHADLDLATLAGLVHSDRTLVTLGEALLDCSAAELGGLLGEIDAQLDYRRSPSPTSTS
jgi:hypothetical protein